MAKGSVTVEVNVEEALHRCLGEFADTVYKEHGIIVKSVYFDWADISGVGGNKSLLKSIHIETRTER